MRVAGHFGEWLQGVLDGEVALVTLPCPALAAHVTRVAGGAALSAPDVPNPHLLLRALGLPEEGRFETRLDMPPGGGAGASTASLVALARAAGARADPETLAAACLAAEGAVDPLMRPAPDTCLWAPRAARALRALPPPPAAEIVGGFLGRGARTDPEDRDFAEIGDLVALWEEAAGDDDLVRCAALASVSAASCSALRGPADEPTPDLARALGALGWARAHTGSARALIFAPGAAPKRAEAALAEAGMTGILRFRLRDEGRRAA